MPRLKTEADRAAFRERYGPWALVAGASEGIGAAFCRQLAELGLNVVMLARRPGPLQVLADELAAAHGVETLAVPTDLAEPNVHEHVQAAIGDRSVGLFVYNACASTIGPFLGTSERSKTLSLDVNCRGPVLLLPGFVEPMKARGQGGVVLMGSMSGLVGTAMVTTYAATKAFTQVLGEGLWAELGPLGIDVVVCAAGATTTPNFQRQTPDAKQGRALPLPPEAVADCALRNLDRGPFVVPGAVNRAVAFGMQRLMTRRMAAAFMGRNTTALYGDD